jgi:pimeloyl-ACP methyl ester carboxylesterase
MAARLQAAERAILAAIKSPISQHNTASLNTISSLHPHAPTSHYLLLHGWAAGLGIWVNNFDHLVRNSSSQVHAIDLRGWGRSISSPSFSSCGGVDDAIDWFVDSLNCWRIEMKINALTLVG